MRSGIEAVLKGSSDTKLVPDHVAAEGIDVAYLYAAEGIITTGRLVREKARAILEQAWAPWAVLVRGTAELTQLEHTSTGALNGGGLEALLLREVRALIVVCAAR